MELEQLFTDRQAVSPVVGVVLMIAIAVVLAAVVGGVVLGLGSEPADSPDVSFNFKNKTSAVEATHTGGDAIPTSAISVQVEGSTSGTVPSVGDEWETGEGGDVTTTGAMPDDVIRIVWNDPNSDKSAILGKYVV